MSKVIAIMPASGSSTRMGLENESKSKLLIKLKDGRTIFEHSLTMIAESGIDSVIIPTCENLVEEFKLIANKVTNWNLCKIVTGGNSRFESVNIALNFIDNTKHHYTHVLIHDAARPCCPSNLVKNILLNLSDDYGVVLGIPATNTIKRIDTNANVLETLKRDELFEIQTPQIFPFNKFLLSFFNADSKQGSITFYDDASVYESSNFPVKVIAGDTRNIKVTYNTDIQLINSFLK